MHKGRLEAFSDAVIAIAMTIMVLELKPPATPDLAALAKIGPTFLYYVLSFVNLGIYWNNHHHLIQAAKHVNGAVLWANMHLLFWLSLIPLGTEWMGADHLSTIPTAAYGVVLLLCGVAYYILCQTLVVANGRDSVLARALGQDRKGKLSVVLYAVGVPLALVSPILSCATYVAVAFMWLIPDRRFERALLAGHEMAGHDKE